MMASAVGMIQDLGVEVEHISRGCISLCQPVDIGVNKPFKNRIREQWEERVDDCGRISKRYNISVDKREHNLIDSVCNKQHARTNDTKCPTRNVVKQVGRKERAFYNFSLLLCV